MPPGNGNLLKQFQPFILNSQWFIYLIANLHLIKYWIKFLCLRFGLRPTYCVWISNGEVLLIGDLWQRDWECDCGVTGDELETQLAPHQTGSQTRSDQPEKSGASAFQTKRNSCKLRTTSAISGSQGAHIRTRNRCSPCELGISLTHAPINAALEFLPPKHPK